MGRNDRDAWARAADIARNVDPPTVPARGWKGGGGGGSNTGSKEGAPDLRPANWPFLNIHRCCAGTWSGVDVHGRGPNNDGVELMEDRSFDTRDDLGRRRPARRQARQRIPAGQFLHFVFHDGQQRRL